MSLSLSHGRQLEPGSIGIDGHDLPPWQDGAIDLGRWFGPQRASNPLELEVGSGKGTFLVQQAMQTPDINYVGIEYTRQFWLYAADRCRRHGLNNVKLVHAEAAFFIRNFVPDGCFTQAHVYFPDPWPKKRHHKRRLIQVPFLRELAGTLKPDALLRMVTDHTDYFQWMQQQVVQVADLYMPLPFESPQSAGAGELVGTNFERKYRRQGRPFHALILRRL